jgi:hypothetical protein
MLKAIARLLSNPRHLLAHRNIFLFSHMRANTSLFGHILGSHPDIEGYYEMHIGYYSWKSLWRQKLLYLESHKPKATSRIYFDKLLHDYCVVSPEILKRPTTQSIFMMRGPDKTIKSIIGLYQKIDPAHEFARADGAVAYYIKRVEELVDTSNSMPSKYYYLDAEDLIQSSTETLDALGKWLGLSQPLAQEYQLFNKTGAPQAGDPSDLMSTGRINKVQHNYSDIDLPMHLLADADKAYRSARDSLVKNSCNKVVSGQLGMEK